MFSNIFLNSKNLLSNVEKLQSLTDKKLCVMVKANAYGHGSKEIVTILKDKISCFGVSNMTEALEIRPLTDKTIIVFGGCEDYKKCIENNISFIAFSLNHIKKIVKIANKLSKKPKIHLCLNSGMNRYGVRSEKEFLKIIDFLSKNNIELEGFYTHFSSLTTDKSYTEKQKQIFYRFVNLIPKSWKTIVHVGGGQSLFNNIEADMYRVGLHVYGYGEEYLKPVLSLKSEIVDINEVKKGEHIGYLCGYTALNDMRVATLPLGYGDGLTRKLSNKLEVVVNGKKAKNVGNICMDAFMIDVTNINCKIGDEVTIFDNVTPIAKLAETTEYEVLTNLSKFRGERKIK